MATEEEVAAGLLDWINSLGVAEPIKTIDDLNDGGILWNSLRTLYFLPKDTVSDLQSAQNKSIVSAFLAISLKM